MDTEITKKKKVITGGCVKINLQDYCANTSIHGVKYLGESNRPLMEKLWWICVFILSVIGSTSLIYKVWCRWQISPVIVYYEETPTLVWKIPFPTVTICTETKSKQSVFNYTHYIYSTKLTEEEEKMMNEMSLLCNHYYLSSNGDKTTNESVIEFYKEVAPPLDELLWFCRWKISQVNCSELFKPVITEEGLCFSFNLLHSTDLYRSITLHSQEEIPDEQNTEWSLEDGYSPSAPLDTYPRRALGSDVNNAMVVILRGYEYDSDYYCRGPVRGFKVLLHNPAEVPRVSERYVRLSVNNEIVLSVQPRMMTTSVGLKDYPSNRRLCYFPTERQLAFYKIYTQRNCELECLTNFTLKKCGCVMFYMPREASTHICGSGSFNCTNRALDKLSIEQIITTEPQSESGNMCNCLPACTSLQYDYDISQASFDLMKLFSRHKENETETEGLQLTRLVIYFKDRQFMTSRKRELPDLLDYGILDFLANCGGLLGLFSGFSILSLVEIIYYLTLRFWNNLKRQNRRKVSDAEQVEAFKNRKL